MKGKIMTTLADMVQQQYGLGTWYKLLDDTGLSGIYTTGEIYPDSELTALLECLAERSNMSVAALMHEFGVYTFPGLIDMLGGQPPQQSFLDFLESVDQVIHVEIKKLYPEAQLPSFTYSRPDKNTLIIEYRSHRNMCALAEGMIQAAAERFQVNYRLIHETCKLRGAEACLMEVVVDEHRH